MVKGFIKKLFRSTGYQIISTDRLSVELENDLRRLTAGNPIRCVFDVGANVGQSAVRFATAFPGASIYSFEPVPQTFEILESRTHRLPRVSVFNRAMGESRGRSTIYFADDSGRNSMVARGNEPRGQASVEVDTIDLFSADNGVNSIDLLKIDVEGFEPRVLLGAARMLRDQKIRFICAECEFTSQQGAPHASFFQLHDLLSPLDYCVAGSYPESFDLNRGAFHTNILFALKSRLPSHVGGNIT